MFIRRIELLNNNKYVRNIHFTYDSYKKNSFRKINIIFEALTNRLSDSILKKMINR